MFGQFVSFNNLVPPFPISVVAIFFFVQSHYIGILYCPNLLPLPLVVIVGGNRVVLLRALLVVQQEMD